MPVSKSARRCVAALHFLDQHIVSKQLDGELRHSRQEAVSSYVAQIITPNDPPADSAQDQEAYFLDQVLQPGDGGYYNTMDIQDIAWLHSVPMDLMQNNTSDMFG